VDGDYDVESLFIARLGCSGSLLAWLPGGEEEEGMEDVNNKEVEE
jgi:hypothetical protein